jgi:hypothetical protein
MNTIINHGQSLQARIMRRVWYSYIIRTLFSLATLRGFVLGSSAVLFIQLVSVHNIVLNLLSVEVGAVPSYIWQVLATAFASGEFLKLLTLGVIVFSLLTFRVSLRGRSVTPRVMQPV